MFFANNLYYGNTLANLLTISRTAQAYVLHNTGLLQLIAANTLRIGTGIGLLIEEARTNSMLQSSDATSASWSTAAITVTANSIAAPDGTVTADLVVPTNGSTLSYFFQTMSHTSGSSYTTSVYLKPAGMTLSRMQGNLASGSIYADFTLTGFGSVTPPFSNSNATNISTSISALANGWYRCSISFTANATESASWFVSLVFTGDGVNGWYQWGAQFENGAFVTSYIPTTTAAVTRDTDIVQAANQLVPPLSTDLSSCYFHTAPLLGLGVTPRLFDAQGGASFQINTSIQNAEYSNLSTCDAPLGYGTWTTTEVKSTAGWAYGSVTCNANGGGVNTNADSPPNATPVTIGNRYTGDRALNGYIKRLTAWDQKMSDFDLDRWTRG